MNGDLISREAAAQILMEKSYSYVVSLFPTSDECKTAREIAKECAEAVRQMEAVDAEPVRHGKWIENGDDDMDAGMWHCSECGHEIYSDLALIEEMQEQGYALFCEHCGAKMDGEK